MNYRIIGHNVTLVLMSTFCFTTQTVNILSNPSPSQSTTQSTQQSNLSEIIQNRIKYFLEKKFDESNKHAILAPWTFQNFITYLDATQYNNLPWKFGFNIKYTEEEKKIAWIKALGCKYLRITPQEIVSAGFTLEELITYLETYKKNLDSIPAFLHNRLSNYNSARYWGKLNFDSYVQRMHDFRFRYQSTSHNENLKLWQFAFQEYGISLADLNAQGLTVSDLAEYIKTEYQKI